MHNGIIENYQALKASLADREYASETDTEVVAHLVAAAMADADEPDLLAAVRSVVNRLEGAFSLCFLSVDAPARSWSPSARPR